ncbi:MAG: hypothetical protein DRN26_00275 [Thermoplasmata archaeon]|nr:MAG: hypothetical protein DRN26_00275 [Thermoplasmata archaeon]
MLKVYSKDGKLKFVLLDDDTQLQEAETLLKVLKEYGIELEAPEELKEQLKPTGISQDDTKRVKGDD